MQVQKYREALREEHGLDYAEACAFIPTGWAAVSTYNVKNSRQTKGGASCLPTRTARDAMRTLVCATPPHTRARAHRPPPPPCMALQADTNSLRCFAGGSDGRPLYWIAALTVQLAPYSEHSSFGELMEFVRFLKPKRVIPTVC